MLKLVQAPVCAGTSLEGDDCRILSHRHVWLCTPTTLHTTPITTATMNSVSRHLGRIAATQARSGGQRLKSFQNGLNSPRLSCIAPTASYSQTSLRSESSGNGPDPMGSDTDFAKIRRLEDANPDRIEGIQVNPDGIGASVLPGNLVYRHYKWTGNTRKVPLELVHGYFWMVNDLSATQGKPTLSNDALIPAAEAQAFPMLFGLESLSGEKTDIPYFFMQDGIDCTLVNIAFRDSGYKNIESWAAPFRSSLGSNCQSVQVSITERWALYLLRGALASVMRRNTPPEQHANTLMYFGSNVDEFRDILRMHNIMANFCFLVDSLGRVRFAGSGPATDADIARVVTFAKQLAAENKSKPQRKRRR
eukprot:Nitzschia sp. Nitz4//scaffold78_size91513//76429//77579//NITZ4_004937-RA/size91513-snap-gene-0.142-mRNA-1//-1//CDS//3329558154//3083//frame0